jgi:hypothetical protein
MDQTIQSQQPILPDDEKAIEWQEKKPYQKPELVCFGEVKDITLGFSTINDPESGGSGTKIYRR